MVSFKVSALDWAVIHRIAMRFQKIARKYEDETPDLQEIRMDLTACHANGCPLLLRDLARTDDFNLMHDVCGIRDHLNRKTGKLEGFFVPRFAKPSRIKMAAA